MSALSIPLACETTIGSWKRLRASVIKGGFNHVRRDAQRIAPVVGIHLGIDRSAVVTNSIECIPLSPHNKCSAQHESNGPSEKLPAELKKIDVILDDIPETEPEHAEWIG
jgi:hypothetical protein